MYSPEQSLKEKEMAFIDEIINESFKPVESKISTWSRVVVFLGTMLYLYSKKDKSISTLKDLVGIDFSAKKIEDANVPEHLITDISKIAFPASPDKEKAIDLAYQNVGTYIKGIQDDARKEIRTTLIQSYLGKIPAQQVAHELHNKFETLQKNFRLIAVTENSRMAMNAFLASIGEGEQILGQSMPDACPWCKALIHGKVYDVIKTPPTNPNDPKWKSAVWVGKTNYNLDRNHWHPIIPLHPNCRCYWLHFDKRYNDVDKDGHLIVKGGK